MEVISFYWILALEIDGVNGAIVTGMRIRNGVNRILNRGKYSLKNSLGAKYSNVMEIKKWFIERREGKANGNICVSSLHVCP